MKQSILALIGGAVLIAVPGAAVPGAYAAEDALPPVLQMVDKSLERARSAIPATSASELVVQAVQKTGVLTVTINIALNSSIPTAQSVSCGAGFTTTDAIAFNNQSIGATLNRSVTPLKCVLTIPYKVQTASTATQMMVGASLFSVGTVFRSANAVIPPFPVPTGAKAVTVNMSL